MTIKATAFSSFQPRRALISVSDKRGLQELAQALHQQGVELIATGNTAALLKQQGLPVKEVSEYTGFPEMMDGRVKTLHPAIHAGLLARGEQDRSTLKQHGIKPIDLLVVNLYPFEQVISQPHCDFNIAIENIDIGGPAMVRSAAKNHAYTYVITSPEDYSQLMDCLQTQKAPSDWRWQLAKKAFVQIAAYDATIANYLSGLDSEKTATAFPQVLTCQFTKKTELRYGENPHQQAIFYADNKASSGSLGFANLLQGKPLSYNNLLDADAALDCVQSYPEDKTVCVIVKHASPCGIALGSNTLQAYLKAFQSDPNSAYGGIIAFNQKIETDTAKTILEKQFIEVIIAPEISNEAAALFANKKNIRVLCTGWQQKNQSHWNMKKVLGGLLVQEYDNLPIDHQKLRVVTLKKPSEQQMKDLIFAWLAVKHVKSNAIVCAKEEATIGIGGGQTSRVMSTRIALWQAENMGFDTKGAVMASDAFIPFADTIKIAAQAGISSIIQPGGSIHDEQMIACAQEHEMSMVFTGIRHFKH